MELPKIVKDVLRSSAPTLLAGLALPPPLGLIASAAATTFLLKYLPLDETPAATDNQGNPVLTPEQVARIVAERPNMPQLQRDLRLAEIEAKRVEAQLPLKFEELARKDRADARAMVTASPLAPMVFDVAKTTLFNDRILSYLMLGGGLVLLLATGFFQITLDPIVSNAIFTLIGVVLGRQASRADQVASFLFGSTNSSRAKDETLSTALRTVGEAVSRPASLPPTQPAPEPPSGAASPIGGAGVPATRLRSPVMIKTGLAGLPLADLAKLIRPHARFPGSVQWALTPDGISVDGGQVARTVGQPETVRRIWRDYGELILAAARARSVPLELIVATIAAESHGRPDAYRQEPDKRESSGLMQTLLGTAGEVLGYPVTVEELRDPATSIAAGTGYIAQQRKITQFDPPLVAAAYNAGRIRLADYPGNPWKLHCHPPETGKHVTEFVRWFGDAIRECREADWPEGDAECSFALALDRGH